MNRVTDWIDNRRTARAVEEQVDGGEPVFVELPDDLGTLDVVQMSIDAVHSVVARCRSASYPPDLLISIPKRSCRTPDFHRAAEMIALGHRLTDEALDRASFPGLAHPTTR